jgi:hypothetical protein
MIGRPGVVIGMARVTVRRNRSEGAVCMTEYAVQACMGPGQRKYRMLVRGRNPRDDAVARFAVLGEPSRDVVWRAFIIRLVARVTVGGNWLERTTRMALSAIEAAVASNQWERVVRHVRPLPAYLCVATLAPANPSTSGVIGRNGASQVGLVAKLTFDRSAPELSSRSPGVAALAWRHGVRTHERKSRPRMLGDQAHRRPTGLIMTACAGQTKRRGMWIRMATAAAARHVDFDRSAIVMTTQARCTGMSPLQRIAGFLHVVVGDVVPQDVPAFRHMAYPAVTGEIPVRYQRPPAIAPAVFGLIWTAVEQDDCPGGAQSEQ